MISNNLRRTLRGDTILNRAPGNVDAFQDGIHLDFVNNYHYTKAPGAAPNVAPLTSLFTFTRAGTATFLGRSGLVETAAANQPRIEYDANGRCLGLLMEASRTNLVLQSQTFGTTWTPSSASVTSDTATAPDGTVTADKVVEAAATARHFVTQSITKAAANVQYAVSVFFKAAERTFGSIRCTDGPQTGDARVNIDLTTGVLSSTSVSGVGFSAASATVVPYANGWYRVTLVFTSSADTTLSVDFGSDVDNNQTALSYAGNGTSGILVWGAQVEAAAFASSYIPTTTLAVARAADFCSRTVSSEVSATVGTVVLDGRASPGQATQNQFSWLIGSLAGTDSVFLVRPISTDIARANIFTASVGQGPADAGSFVNSAKYRHAMAWNTNDLAASFNGSTVVPDTSITLGWSPNTLTIGADASATLQANGHILRFDYWPERKSNGYLQQWSRP